VDFEIAGITATADDYFVPPGGDYTGTISFTEGLDQDSFYILTIPDNLTESNETLSITLSNPVNCTIDRGTGTAYITDDDSYGVYAESDGEPTPDDPYWIIGGMTLSVPANEGVLVNDVDYDPNSSDELTAHLVEQAHHGIVSLNLDGSFTYFVTEDDYEGYDDFEYYAEAQDGRKSSPTKVFLAADRIVIKANGQTITPSSETEGEFQVPSEWVGKKIVLTATPEGPVNASLPEGTTFVWTVAGKAVANWFGEDFASHEVGVNTELNEAEPNVFWVSGGMKAVNVTATLPLAAGGNSLSADGYIQILRPHANATSETTDVTVWVGQQSNRRMLQFGHSLQTEEREPGDVNSAEGISFTWHADATAGGDYQWVQLIAESGGYTKTKLMYDEDGKIVVDDNDNPILGTEDFFATTGGYVLDIEYPSSEQDPFPDSPAFGESGAIHVYGSMQFRTYLMWNPDKEDKDNAIWVPISVTNWWWEGDASLDGGTWELNSSPTAHADDPDSIDTIEYPSWTNKVPEAFVEQPND